MLGMFSILPLCKGWDYKSTTWTRELTRGQFLEVARIEDFGYLLFATVISNDSYGGFSLAFQGADLSLYSSGIVNAKNFYDYGAYEQDPSGFVQRYYQPNPQSTAGVYTSALTTMGFQGTAWPYVPTTILTMRLENASTQEKAMISVTFIRLIITDKKQFIRSLRAVMGMTTIQDIDPALLVAGTQEITQKGEFDKQEKK